MTEEKKKVDETSNKEDGDVIVLKKGDILRTIEETKLVSIDLWQGKKVPMRPLADGFWQELQLKQFDNLNLNSKNMSLEKGKSFKEVIKESGVKVEVKEFMENELDSKLEVISFCLFGIEEISKEEVKNLQPIGILDELYNNALKVSGINIGEAVQKFRNDG